VCGGVFACALKVVWMSERVWVWCFDRCVGMGVSFERCVCMMCVYGLCVYDVCVYDVCV